MTYLSRRIIIQQNIIRTWMKVHALSSFDVQYQGLSSIQVNLIEIMPLFQLGEDNGPKIENFFPNSILDHV